MKKIIPLVFFLFVLLTMSFTSFAAEGGDEKPDVIIDNGTGYVKAGFSGEEGPRAVFPAVVGSIFSGGNAVIIICCVVVILAVVGILLYFTKRKKRMNGKQ